MLPLDLLSACESVYASAQIIGGPDGRDGVSLFPLASGGSLLVFRGTLTTGPVSFLDWLNDLRAELEEFPDYPGRVHKGFAASLADLWPKLPRLAPPLWITGHSKGGALASLAATRLARMADLWRVPQALACVTFAAPMTGNYQYSYGAFPVTRYENPHDLVPRLPPFDYWPALGTRISAPSDWPAPDGVEANHTLESGYRPWIEALSQAA